MGDRADRTGAFGANRIETLARAIHAGYQHAGGTTLRTAADVRWDQLAEAYRDSNTSHAADIGRKLAAVGCAAEPTGRSSELAFTFEPAELEFLAEMEHERWWKERVSQGLDAGPGT